MQDSVSANYLHTNSFKHSPLPSSKPQPNQSFLKVTQFPTEGFLPFSENSKKILSRVFSQERLDSRQRERIASNLTSSSSKKRLILKNRQKFPSDFFQDSNSKISHELLEKRLTNHAESLVPSMSIPQINQDLLSNPEMLDFINADQQNIHETPKFSCDNSPMQNYEAQYIQEPRYNNLFEASKDRAGTAANLLTNSIDNIKKLEFNRIYSALLPNTRKLGSLTERVLNEGSVLTAKRDAIQIRKGQETAGLSALLNESNPELAKPVSRVSSQESMYRPIMLDNTRHYNESREKDPSSEAQTRPIRNKQLEEIIALRRRSSEILSKASQSALPKIKNHPDPSEHNISLLKAKAEGFIGLNLSYVRKEDRGVKAFDYRLRPTENSTLGSRIGSENSPLLYNDSFMNKTKQSEEAGGDPFAHLVLTSAKKPGYDIIVHSARKPSGVVEAPGDILSHSDGEEKGGTALRRYTSVEGKAAALLSANELERKLNGRSEGGARNKAKIILHRRHASMQLDHAVLLKYEPKKGIEEKPRHGSAQRVVGKPPQGHVNNYIKESPAGLKSRIGKTDKLQQSRSAINIRPDTMEIKSRINSKGGPKKDYNSVVSDGKNGKPQQKNYNTQAQLQVQAVELGENNQNLANKVSTRQRGFTFGKDSKEEVEKNNTVAKSLNEDIVIMEDRKESETSCRMDTREDSIIKESQDLMIKEAQKPKTIKN